MNLIIYLILVKMGCGYTPKAIGSPVNGKIINFSQDVNKVNINIPVIQLENSIDSRGVEFVGKRKMSKAGIKHEGRKDIRTDKALEMFKQHFMNYSSLIKNTNNEVYDNTVKVMKKFIIKKKENKSNTQELLEAKDFEIFNFLRLKKDKNGEEILPDPLMYNTLDNKKVEDMNYCFKYITKYYKRQVPLTNKMEIKDPILKRNTVRRLSYMRSTTIKKYADTLFPPTWESIIGMRNGKYFDPNEKRREKATNNFPLKSEDIIWLRPEEIFTGGLYCLFANDISVDDIMQGNLGNCYFLSSLAAMTEIPQLIYQLFHSYEVSLEGYYEVAVRIQGKWKRVIVDDFFPCHAKTRKPIFAKPRDAEIWVMLLEKVWAKINGGYLNIIAGSSAQILSCFTSFSLSSLHHRKLASEELWESIKSSDEAGYILTSNSYDSSKVNVEKYGIVPGHSFTLTKAKEAVISGRRVRLLNLRNPWGYKEWNGAWSDNSSEWTAEAIKALNFDKHDFISKDDGQFWISFEDFVKFFSISNICRVFSPQCCQHYSIPKDKADSPHIFELQLAFKNIFTVNACKKTWRFYRKLPSDAELPINIIIVKKVADKNNEVRLDYITSTHENEHDPTLECALDEGTYYIYVHANYKHSSFVEKKKFVMLFTSNKYFQLTYKGTDENFDVLREIIVTRIEKTYLHSQEDYTYSTNKFEMTTYGALYIANRFKDSYKILGPNQSENFEILTPTSFDKNINVYLEPGEKVIIIGLRKIYYAEFTFNYDIDPVKLDKSSNNLHNSVSSNSIFLKLSPTLPIFKNLVTESIKGINEDKYDFIFKKIEMDMSNIITRINYIDYALNYFITKYPEVTVIVDTVPELEDGEEVIFQDTISLSSNTCYLGEWKVNQDLVKHGRGLLIFSDGTYYMGQFVNDQNEGFGILKYPSGEKIEINWVEGRIHGKGKHYKVDGFVTEVEYDHGRLINEVNL